jgi:hypothetical protein
MYLKNATRLLWSLCLVLVLSVTLAAAQDETARTLESGAAVTGTLDSDNVAQVYTIVFEGTGTQEIDLTATNADGLGLALLLTNSQGQPIAQAVDAEAVGEVALSTTLAQPDTYYVTVLAVGGESTEGTFELTLDVVGSTPVVVGDTTPLLTTNGLQITLEWGATADMNLEVRDPVGGSLRWATPDVPSGGRFGTNVNQNCEAVTSNASEEASWLPGAIPTGSYEILVYFDQDCENSGESVSFTITTVIDGTAQEPVNGTLEPGQVFISSFDLTSQGNVTRGANGLNADNALAAAAQDLLADAQPITRGTAVQGSITNEQPFQAFSFTGQANDVVTISLNATSGSLDPLVFLLDANGNLIDTNDDAGDGITNSAIVDRLLVTDGTYTIVATRYGQALGGTEGNFDLTVTGPTANVPAEVLALNLPNGAIEVSLVWNTNADLQLLVRDPQGESVFDDDLDIPSGGRLAAQGNVNCQVSETAPVSYIYWPDGRVPAGSYEVEVWYQNQCNDTSTVLFTLTITVNDEVIFTDTVQPLFDERYLTSFTIGVDGTVTPSDGGIIGGSETLNYQAELDSARPIESGETVTGSITPDNKFDVYVFEGTAEDVVNIGMQATSGTLDPTLFLIGPDGAQIAQNDDAVANEDTNSLIDDFTLPEDGQYIIIASHFGALYGGTTGVYSLTFQQLN